MSSNQDNISKENLKKALDMHIKEHMAKMREKNNKSADPSVFEELVSFDSDFGKPVHLCISQRGDLSDMCMRCNKNRFLCPECSCKCGYMDLVIKLPSLPNYTKFD